MADQKRLRVILRWVHISLGLVLLCYIYSPFSKYPAFKMFVRCFVVPVVVLSGLWIWKMPLLNRLFRIK